MSFDDQKSSVPHLSTASLRRLAFALPHDDLLATLIDTRGDDQPREDAIRLAIAADDACNADYDVSLDAVELAFELIGQVS